MEEPTGKLDHLLVEIDAGDDAATIAAAEIFNDNVKDLTKVECFICGGPGHFMDNCELHQ